VQWNATAYNLPVRKLLRLRKGGVRLVELTLIDKLVRAEEVFGEMGVAQRCGVQQRMYQLAKTRKTRFGTRSLAAILKSFPELRDDVLAYIETRDGAAA
jgi:hypothetical protein